MVHLNRIYTRSGDEGQTSLGDGTRVAKTHPRVVAYGAVDELNSVLGLVQTSGLSEELSARLRIIQNDLFDVGADLCVPEPEEPTTEGALRVTERQTLNLEGWIDELVPQLKPLDSFILPGGTPTAAALHHARTVCRRAEIDVLRLAEFENVNRQLVAYLNRLSDLLFVMARICNHGGTADLLWKPGQNQA